MPRKPRPLSERLMGKFEPEPNSGCWLWTAAVAGSGYGHIGNRPGGNKSAHRAMYELLVGPIPDGLELDHLCRVRICVNPAHLEPVTRYTNMLRGNTFTRRNAAVTHCPYGHPYDDVNTYRLPAHPNQRVCRQCKRRREYRRTHPNQGQPLAKAEAS